ncbi:oligosaccharide flippase family protein [Microbacterium sp. SMR1]|uniref:oligosaccharide flippase family protein n=1 Tax=Microbacterium sp. SMR1 TaxID=1497340 RepID=UPI0015EC5524|nr:oligosaccharide flippase family protein [Microbacterium sp. SMR1]
MTIENFAFWSILASVSSIALSLDFGGVALISARFYSDRRALALARSAALSGGGSLLVGLLGILAWLLYQGTDLGTAIGFWDGAAAIITMAAAAAVRSTLMVISQIGLLSDTLLLRNLTTAGHALVAASLTFILLFTTNSFWALPLGWLISGLILLVPCYIWALRAGETTALIEVAPRSSWIRFAGVRTVSTILGTCLLQADRWVIGALGGPALLAIYEVAWRFATLPRFLLQNLAARIGSDAASMRFDQMASLRSLLRRSTAILAVLAIPAMAGCLTGYVLFMWLTGGEPDFALAIAMTIAFTLVGLTAPTSFAGASLGVAGIDLPYIGFSIIVATVGLLMSLGASSPLPFIFGYIAAFIASVPVFFLYAPRWVLAALSARG